LINTINIMSWLTAEQALRALNTKPQSLYASVSRGRIRARRDPDDPRRSLYNAEDVGRLAGRSRRKADIAAEAIQWGEPVLETAISTVSGGRLFYRGRDAIALADIATLEDVAALLWARGGADFDGVATMTGDADALGRCLAALAHAVTNTTTPTAETIVGTIATAITGLSGTAPVHRRLAAAWRRPEAANLIREALVVLADHELNASTFAARITASTGASLAACVTSGLLALTGHRHGGAAGAVGALAARIERRDVRMGAPPSARLPGFGHPLYPEGDPRAALLLEGFPLPPAYAELLRIGQDVTGEAPNVDFALAALAAAFRLPPDAPLLLFALARSVGWIAHAEEQQATGTLIRPRARYIGPPLG
jgi:citrate synthase